MMKHLYIGLALWLGMVPASALAAQDLVDIYTLAAESDPELRAAEFRYRAALEAIPQAQSLNLPQVTGSGAYTFSRQEAGGSTDENDFGTLSLSVSQALVNLENRARLRQASASAAQAEAVFQNAQQNLLLRVSEAYFDVLNAESVLEFARSEKVANQRQLEQAERRFEVGLIAITDVREAQASFDLARAREIVAENDLVSAREALARITGEFHEQLADLGEDGTPLNPPEPVEINDWVETARAQNLDLLSTLFGVEVAQENVRLQRAGRYPTLSLVGQHQYTNGIRTVTGIDALGQARSADNIHDTQVSLQLSWDLYTGGRVSSQIREASEQVQEARQNLLARERLVVQQTRDAYRGVLTGISEVQALEQALVSNATALRATEAGFEVGTRTTVDVLLAQRNFFSAQRDLADARYRYILNRLRLKQAAGTLALPDLETVDAWLTARSPEDRAATRYDSIAPTP